MAIDKFTKWIGKPPGNKGGPPSNSSRIFWGFGFPQKSPGQGPPGSFLGKFKGFASVEENFAAWFFSPGADKSRESDIKLQGINPRVSRAHVFDKKLVEVSILLWTSTPETQQGKPFFPGLTFQAMLPATTPKSKSKGSPGKDREEGPQSRGGISGGTPSRRFPPLGQMGPVLPGAPL